MKKGFIYTLEVLIAISLITLTVVFLFRFSPQTTQSDITILKISGMNALVYLDQYYDLDMWVFEGNETNIENTLEQLLPEGINYEAEVCETECNTIGVPTTKSVVAVDYYVSSYGKHLVSSKVRLWLWV